MKIIQRARREWFGAVVYSEHPGFVAFLDRRSADALGLAPLPGLAEGVFRAPVDVHLAITSRCGAACDGCYATPLRGAGMDMDLALAARILDNLASLDVFTVALGGGEPLLHPDVFGIAACARERGIVPNITTNGRHVDRQTAEACRIFGAVHLSCHGADDLDRLAPAVRLLRDAEVRPGLNVLVSRRSFAQLPRIFAWAREQRLARVLLLRFKRTAANAGSDGLCLAPEQLANLYPWARRLARRSRVALLLDCSCFPLIALHHVSRRALRFFDVQGCRGGNVFMAIDVDGSWKPCSFWPTSFGDAARLTPEAWRDGAEVRGFRNRRRFPVCASCSYLELCNGGCPLAMDDPCGSSAASPRA